MVPASAGGTGSGITRITSTGGTVTITNPTGPTTNLEAGTSSGTVTSVSVVSNNGLAGTVATATTTPAITLSTTVTGILKGNGTAISAATAGTDYLTPSGNGSALTGLTVSQVSGAAPLASATLTGVPAAPTATVGTNTTQIATTAFVQAAVSGGGGGSVTAVSVATANGFAGTVANPTSTPAITITTTVTGNLIGNGAAISAAVTGVYLYAAVTADPNPAVVGTYYHTVLASTGSFTLPSSGLTAGNMIQVKNRSATTTLNIVGTVDGNASFTVGPGLSVTFVWNGTDWDAN